MTTKTSGEDIGQPPLADSLVSLRLLTALIGVRNLSGLSPRLIHHGTQTPAPATLEENA